MKVYEVLDDTTVLKTDIKRNKGKAVDAIVRGIKRKANGVPREDNEIAPETNVVAEGYMVQSAEGKIDSAELDKIIVQGMRHFDGGDLHIEEIRRIVIDDYADTDISQITTRDVIEILQASGF